VGPRADLDGCGKFHPPPGFDSGIVQPVVGSDISVRIITDPLSVVRFPARQGYIFFRHGAHTGSGASLQTCTGNSVTGAVSVQSMQV